MSEQQGSGRGAAQGEANEQAGQGKSQKGGNARDHLANERTLLAWVRTAISIMALGFVVAKFGIYLKALASGKHTTEATSSRSGLLGIMLVAVGAATIVLALVRYLRTRRLIIQDSYQASDWLDIITSLLIAGSAVVMMLVLLLGSG
ncbi:MAG: YidH family protein [Dehalococcoidia bacterium]